MMSRLLARLIFAASFLVATQLCLQHPFEHVKSSPAQEQACGACMAFASLGTAAVSHAALHIDLSPASTAPLARPLAFTAAFTPHFRSQAPPLL